MLIQAREIPIDPSMVSLWVPGGDDHAKDLIRNNFGQCDGTHPNVPVLPNVINPSLGWSFDGTDDYIELENRINIGKVHTCSSWFLIDSLVTEEPADYKVIFGDNETNAAPLFVRISTGSLYYNVEPGYKNVIWGGYETGVWHLFTTTRNGTSVNFYIDAVKVGLTQTLVNNLDVNIKLIGNRNAPSYWWGLLALPFIANSVWSVAKVNNFYLATKGIFAPRG